MTKYSGRVRNGVVVLDEGAPLNDGTPVKVEPLTESSDDRPAIYDRLLELAGTAEGLPPDLARNHDHYLHGTPRA
jgi:hypothetical protein